MKGKPKTYLHCTSFTSKADEDQDHCSGKAGAKRRHSKKTFEVDSDTEQMKVRILKKLGLGVMKRGRVVA